MNSYVVSGYLVTGISIGTYVFSLLYRRHKQRARFR